MSNEFTFPGHLLVLFCVRHCLILGKVPIVTGNLGWCHIPLKFAPQAVVLHYLGSYRPCLTASSCSVLRPRFLELTPSYPTCTSNAAFLTQPGST